MLNRRFIDLFHGWFLFLWGFYGVLNPPFFLFLFGVRVYAPYIKTFAFPFCCVDHLDTVVDNIHSVPSFYGSSFPVVIFNPISVLACFRWMTPIVSIWRLFRRVYFSKNVKIRCFIFFVGKAEYPSYPIS